MLRILKIVPKTFLSPEFDRSHLLLEVILRVEEECLIFLPLGMLDRIVLLVQYQSRFFHEQVQFFKQR